MAEFRQMRRMKQQLSDEECRELLRSEKRGVLSLIGENGYPYGLPINYVYDEKEEKLYFHGAKTGHKIDAIRDSHKASFCVYNHGYRNEGEWALNVKSVILFGKIYPVADHEKTIRICRELCKRFTDDESYLEHEIESSGNSVLCLEFDIEHMTGKRVKES